MDRQFFYLFRLRAVPDTYRLGITADVNQELDEGGLGLDPALPRRPRRSHETELVASCWLGEEAEAVRCRVWVLLGRNPRWGNAQLVLSAQQVELVKSEILAAAKDAVRVPVGWIHPGWDWGEDQLNAGLEDAVAVNLCRPISYGLKLFGGTH